MRPFGDPNRISLSRSGGAQPTKAFQGMRRSMGGRSLRRRILMLAGWNGSSAQAGMAGDQCPIRGRWHTPSGRSRKRNVRNPRLGRIHGSLGRNTLPVLPTGERCTRNRTQLQLQQRATSNWQRVPPAKHRPLPHWLELQVDTKSRPTAKCWWCLYRTQTRKHLFKNCPHWTAR